MAISRTFVAAYKSSDTSAPHGTGGYTTSSISTVPDGALVSVDVMAMTADGVVTDIAGNLSLTCSVGGNTITAVQSANDATIWAFGVKQWVMRHTTGSFTLTADCGAANIHVYFVFVTYRTGASSTVGGKQTGTDADGDGAASITLDATPASSSDVHAAVCVSMASGNGAVTFGTGWTELSDVTLTSWIDGQVQARTGSTSTTVGWDDLATSGTPNKALMLAYEVVESSTGLFAGSMMLMGVGR